MALWFGAAGCSKPAPRIAAPEPPVVTVQHPQRRQLDSVTEATGRLEAMQTLIVQSQVTGYLKEIKFVDGQVVKPGDVLFEIDSVPYQAALKLAEANVAKAISDVATAKQRVTLAKLDFDRGQQLIRDKSISQQEFDTYATTFETAKTTLAAAESAVLAAQSSQVKAEFDLKNCTIRNEVTVPGRVGRTEITVGNLVTSGTTKLCSVTSLDPIYAYWYVDEQTSLAYRRKIYDTKDLADPRGEQKLRCWVGLKDESLDSTGKWPHQGIVDYIAPQIVRGSGTREIRGVLQNPQFRLTPGDSIRVQVEFGSSQEYITVPENAIGSQQQQKFVYCVVDKDNQSIVEFRPVKLGPTRQLNGERLQIIESGLSVEDRVVVNGLLRVRPGLNVKPIE